MFPGYFKLADVLPVGICSLGQDMSIQYWNCRLEEWTGFKREEMIGKPVFDKYPHLGQRKYMNRVRQVFSDRLPVFFSPQIHPHLIPVRNPDGSFMYQRTTIVPVIEGGIVISALLTIEDSTEAVSQVYEYRAMRDKALADLSERKRAEFVAREANRKLGLLNSVTRHDIKNQLTAILAYGELLAEEDPDPGHRRYISSILQAARTIDRQIGYTKEYQEVGVNPPVWIRLQDTVARAVRVAPDLQIEISDRIGTIEIYADPLADRIFTHLFENTKNHGKTAKKIMISAHETEEGLSIFYTDDGVGIEEKEKSRIFSRGYGPNTGFGLSLSREILSLTGMGISEEGLPGKGARFRISVPPGVYRHRREGLD
jgi:PAS domain S-box-containing protein